MERRDFIKKLGATTGGILVGGNYMESISKTLNNQNFIKAPYITANFEKLGSDANMPDGINRYRIRKLKEGNSTINGIDLMGIFFEVDTNKGGKAELNFGTKNDITDYKEYKNLKQITAVVTALPFSNGNQTEGLKIQNGRQLGNEVLDYYGDNALVYFKDGDSGIIKVKIGDLNNNKNLDEKSKDKDKRRLRDPKITAYNSYENNLLNEILNSNNGYTVCQQISIMNNGNRSCFHYGQNSYDDNGNVTHDVESKGEGRLYRFFVETYNGTTGLIDFKEDITINQAIGVMRQNGIKNCVYADIITYGMFFLDTNGNIFTRDEGSKGENSYKLYNKNQFSKHQLTMNDYKNNLILKGK